MTVCSVVLYVCCQSVLLVVLAGGLSLVHELSSRSFCCRVRMIWLVMSGDIGCWCVLFGTLVGVSVLSVMWLELESVSEISSPRWSSVYECQSVECAFTSPVIIELGMLVMYCMQFVMSVSVVSMVSCCGVAVFLGAMYMLAMVMSLKCFVCIFSSCISVLSVLMVCGVLRCVNVVSVLM